MKNKIVVFSNCHGEKYIDIFKKNSNIHELFDIEYLVSYELLDNFSNVKETFESADILIMNNIKTYNNFTVSNLKSLMKPNSKLIVIPFVRFNGYWLPENYKKLKNFSANTVEQFPDIKITEVKDYLNCCHDSEKIIDNYNEALMKLKNIESESDIQFFDWFIDNHLKYPMFRDYKHPTSNLIEYVGNEIMKLIQVHCPLVHISSKLILKNDLYEYGHYKPINDSVKTILNIEYDIDKIFVCSRENYLYNILKHEETNILIQNLDDMKVKLISDKCK